MQIDDDMSGIDIIDYPAHQKEKTCQIKLPTELEYYLLRRGCFPYLGYTSVRFVINPSFSSIKSIHTFMKWLQQ
jgi:hypothetical protein